MSIFGSRTRRSYQGSGALKFRVMIAVAIALFSLFSYLSMGQVNPVTGEKQRVALNTEQEIALGLQAVPQMAAQYGGMLDDPRVQDHADQIGGELLNALNRWLREKNRDNPYQFEFHVLRDPNTVNAFALPGGQVFITAALYARLDTDGQLAGVLGHEIGHVLSRHGAQRMAKQKLTQGLTGAVGVAGGDVNSARMAQMVGQMINMRYGRQDELESDKWGVLLTTMAGYDPRAMIGVMTILEKAGGAGPPEFMSTHPKPANRRKYIDEVLAQVFPEGVPTGLKP